MPLEFKMQGPRPYLKHIIYLQIKAQSASSGPPIGPALGQCGIPAAPFCKEFNERTSILKSNSVVFVDLYIYRTGEYSFDIKLPSNSYFLMVAVRCRKGLRKPGFIFSDIQVFKKPFILKRFKYLTPYMLYEIFLYKAKHYGYSTTYGYSFCRKMLGTLKSIGILVINL
jgi:large subunit ribosomal protein L11